MKNTADKAKKANDIKKTFALLKSEIKGHKGGETVIIVMLTLMIICANIMIVTVSEYIGTIIYLSNPNGQNAVKIIGNDNSSDFSEIKASNDVEFGFEVTCYSANICSVYGISEEFFDENLHFISKSNIDAINNYTGDAIPLLVSKPTEYKVGKKGQFFDGTQYEVVGIIDNTDVKYYIYFGIIYDKFAIALDKGQITLNPQMSPYMFTKLKDDIDKDEFAESIDTTLGILKFDPIEEVSYKFSDSISASVVAIVTFIVSFFGAIINCYLVFCSKRKFYSTIMTVGGKKMLFIRSGGIVKIFQLLISLVVSFLVLLLINILMSGGCMTALSMLISAALAIFVMAVTWLLLKHWLKDITCLEN